MRQGKNLIAAGVGEHRAIPVHEAMDAAEAFEHFESGTKQQVVGVGEEHARAGRLEAVDRLRFDCRLGADRHEDRSLDFAMKSSERRSARF